MEHVCKPAGIVLFHTCSLLPLFSNLPPACTSLRFRWRKALLSFQPAFFQYTVVYHPQRAEKWTWLLSCWTWIHTSELLIMIVESAVTCLSGLNSSGSSQNFSLWCIKWIGIRSVNPLGTFREPISVSRTQCLWRTWIGGYSRRDSWITQSRYLMWPTALLGSAPWMVWKARMDMCYQITRQLTD